jgi:hypothetical protein
MAGDLTTLDHVKEWLGLTGLAIAGVTKANPAVVTLKGTPTYPILTGQAYAIAGVTGMVELAAGEYVATVITPTSFSIPVDATGFSAYTGGGVVSINDPLVARLVSACSQFIQSWLNRQILSSSYVETRNGTGGSIMPVDNYPIKSVATVTVDGVSIPLRPPMGAGSQQVANFGTPYGYTFDDFAIYLSGGVFRRDFQNVVIEYAAGYDTVPADLEQATVDLIGDWFRYADRIGKTSQGIEGQSTSFVNVALTARTLGVLQQYRRTAPLTP